LYIYIQHLLHCAPSWTVFFSICFKAFWDFLIHEGYIRCHLKLQLHAAFMLRACLCYFKRLLM